MRDQMTASNPLEAAAAQHPGHEGIRPVGGPMEAGKHKKPFLDLDGVHAELGRGVHVVTGNRPEELPLKAMWAALSRAPRFLETLALMHDAEAL
jgi:hypothetical protein